MEAVESSPRPDPVEKRPGPVDREEPGSSAEAGPPEAVGAPGAGGDGSAPVAAEWGGVAEHAGERGGVADERDGVADDAAPGDAADAADAEADDAGEQAAGRDPLRFSNWMKRSATGAVMTGIAVGLKEALQPQRKEVPFVIEGREDPLDEDNPIQLHFDPDSPEATVAIIRRPAAGPDEPPPS